MKSMMSLGLFMAMTVSERGWRNHLPQLLAGKEQAGVNFQVNDLAVASLASQPVNGAREGNFMDDDALALLAQTAPTGLGDCTPRGGRR